MTYRILPSFSSFFSNSGLFSPYMKALILFFSMLLVGCGGIVAPKPLPQNIPVKMASADIFSNHAETWTFQNAYGDLTFIDINPTDATHSVWHYSKNAARAYWAPGADSAEVWFDIENDGLGNWYSTGGIFLAPVGPDPILNVPYSVVTKAPNARPYLIMSAQTGFNYTTIFDDTYPVGGTTLHTDMNSRWATSTYTAQVSTPVYTGLAYVSDQWEGPCLHETWYFAPGFGLVEVNPVNEGTCTGGPTPDPNIIMKRIS